ncbi:MULTISPECIES: hypothetical protein [unclassified Bradyrhizobium]|uniref:hypothetical protein n=1 Tax=unclassified Bradyrhizobium TaxID=2631580 RepID=UPI0029169013|nr:MULTISPECIES: hypothetical protein [unclassified Bradyrhizobium]
MTHSSSDALTDIGDIRDSHAFRRETFSRPLRLFRVGNVVTLLDIEYAEGRRFETESDFELAIDKLTLARKAAYSLFRSMPYPVPAPLELSDWLRDYQHLDYVIQEQRSETFFGRFISGDLAENIGGRRIWMRVAEAVNWAFAVSAFSMDHRVGNSSEEELSDVIHEICIEQNLYFGGADFFPDFDGIMKSIRALGEQF